MKSVLQSLFQNPFLLVHTFNEILNPQLNVTHKNLNWLTNSFNSKPNKYFHSNYKYRKCCYDNLNTFTLSLPIADILAISFCNVCTKRQCIGELKRIVCFVVCDV